MKKKSTYEIDLIVSLVNKYKESLKSDCSFQLEQEVFQILESESKNLLNEYKGSKNHAEIKLREFQIKSRDLIKIFISRLKQDMNNKNPETTEPANYNEWKNKLCEIVNIWDLFLSNGLHIKFPYKYLLLKKFFLKRASEKQKNNKSTSTENLRVNLNCMQNFKLLLKGESTALLPRGIVEGDKGFKNVLHFINFIMVIYTYLTMPILYIMGINLPMLSTLEKVVSSFFFYDMIFTFRTAIKDKANNWIYDINILGKNYIDSFLFFDIVSSVPFNLLFDAGSISLKTNLRFVRNLFRLLRIQQIFPAIRILEKVKSLTPIIKMFKLIFTYLLISHWLANIIFRVIDKSIDFSTMERVCYFSTNVLTKRTLKPSCMWLIGMYNASYLLIGQYTNFFQVYETLNPTIEYCIMILGYLIGQFMVAFVYGGVANIILNLNQARDFFSNKVDMLNDHMNFYEVSNETQNDVRTFYNYLWLRHKDIIYSKSHFNLLTESLREKFEQLNLPTNEAYLGKFYKLSKCNTKMIGQILTNLHKKILYPYEILFEEGSVTKGLYVLINGQLEMCNLKIPNMSNQSFTANYAEVIKLIEERNRDKKKNVPNLRPIWEKEDLSVIFPLIACLIKTGRNWQRCFTKDFTDLLFLPRKAFDQLVFNFPVELHVLKHNVMQYIDKRKLFDNEVLFNLITAHSSKSVGSLYEKEYNKHNLWIPIPIPISQRKIAKNYYSSFILKVKNQFREIMVNGDINIGLNAFIICHLISKTEEKMYSAKEIDEEDSKKKKNMDPIEDIKDRSKNLMKLVDLVSNI